MNIFVTGTDTNVGKTVVSATLCLKLRWSYWKPIQTGAMSETDTEWIKRMCPHIRIESEAYRLMNPLSPHTAARLESTEIDSPSITERSKLLHQTIIEGAGGLLVPIRPKVLQIDLIQAMNVSTVLVARTNLGTINHTLLSVEAIRSRGISFLGIVFVGDTNLENQQSIVEYAEAPVLGHLPILSPLSPDSIVQLATLIQIPKGRL